MSPEEDGTRDAVDSEPKHYQLSYSGPLTDYISSHYLTLLSLLFSVSLKWCLWGFVVIIKWCECVGCWLFWGGGGGGGLSGYW